MKEILDYTLRAMAVVLLGLACVTLWKVNARIDEVDKLLSKSNDTLLQVARTAQTIQSTAKSAQEQFDDPLTIQARKNAQLAFTAAAQHVAYKTLPKLDESVMESKGVLRAIKSTVDEAGYSVQHITDVTLPAASQLLTNADIELRATSIEFRKVVDDISKQYLADSHEVAIELRDLLRSGRISVETFDKTAKEFSTRTNKLLEDTDKIAVNIADTTAELPVMARHARRWQPLITGGRLVALLVSIFAP